MFRHIVLLTLKDDTTDVQRQQLLDGLATLPAQIPGFLVLRSHLGGFLGRSHVLEAVLGLPDDLAGVRIVRDRVPGRVSPTAHHLAVSIEDDATTRVTHDDVAVIDPECHARPFLVAR